jgi:Tol biopolymer transport system component
VILRRTRRAIPVGLMAASLACGDSVRPPEPMSPGKLIFVSAVNGKGEIFVKDLADDSEADQITTGDGNVNGLAVDQTTSTIFFARGTPPNNDIFRVNLDGSGLTNLTNNAANNNLLPAVNQITHDVYFSRRGTTGTAAQIFRMRPDGTEMTELTTGTQSKGGPAISPDGQSLAWHESYPSFNFEVVTATITAENAVRLTNRTGNDGSPVWVSNTKLVWSFFETGSNFEIVVASVSNGVGPENVTNNPASDTGPSPGCSENTFTLLSTRAGQSDVYNYDLETGEATKFVLPGNPLITIARRLCA